MISVTLVRKMTSLVQLNLTGEPKRSDATRMLINHTTPNKKKSPERTQTGRY